jgi:hypothetical protein
MSTKAKSTASGIATAFMAVGTVVSSIGLSLDETQEKAKGTTTIIGSLLSNVGGGAATGAAAGLWGAVIGGIVGLIASIPDLIAGKDMIFEDVEEKIKRLTKTLDEAKEKTLISKN